MRCNLNPVFLPSRNFTLVKRSSECIEEIQPAISRSNSPLLKLEAISNLNRDCAIVRRFSENEIIKTITESDEEKISALIGTYFDYLSFNGNYVALILLSI